MSTTATEEANQKLAEAYLRWEEAIRECKEATQKLMEALRAATDIFIKTYG